MPNPALLDDRAIIGEYYRQLEQDTGLPWVNEVSNFFEVNQLTETYAFLGQVPALREWAGGRQAKGLRASSFSITNKPFESTLRIDVDQYRRDKTGQIMVRIGDQIARAQSHWASQLTTLIVNGESTVCYDGQYFFDTDHSEGSSGSQSNDIQVDISALPVSQAGTVTSPSPEEFLMAVNEGIRQIGSFVDDQGEPMNENASRFLVMVPRSLQTVAATALTIPRGTGLSEQVLDSQTTLVSNLRLDQASWTDQFVVFRTDSPVKGLIRQEEVGIEISSEDNTFKERYIDYGLFTSRNVGYGQWQNACQVKMI